MRTGLLDCEADDEDQEDEEEIVDEDDEVPVMARRAPDSPATLRGGPASLVSPVSGLSRGFWRR